MQHWEPIAELTKLPWRGARAADLQHGFGVFDGFTGLCGRAFILGDIELCFCRFGRLLDVFNLNLAKDCGGIRSRNTFCADAGGIP